MKKTIALLMYLFVLLSVKAQKFPFGIEPNSTPQSVNARFPIRVSIIGSDDPTIKRYNFSNSMRISDVVLGYGTLLFKGNQIKSMTFGIENKQDFDKVVNFLTVNYKKQAGPNPFWYYYENVVLRLKISERTMSGVIDYAYLYIEY